MNLSVALQRLPLALLVTSLLAVSLALPVSTAQLTPQDFASSVSDGSWMIEFFSPYCSHCRAFSKAWSDLVAKAGTEMPYVHLAQVNCIDYGDLCNEQKVKGYPTVRLYEAGTAKLDYSGDRTVDDLMKFLNENVKKPMESVERDSITVNPSGEVLALDSSTFQDYAGKVSMFVKFFAPWCGHCKKLAPTWTQLAHRMQNKLVVAEVNCDDHNSLCKSFDVQGYPTLLYVSKDGVKSEYSGSRKLEQLQAFAEKATANGIQAIKPQDLEKVVAAESVVYLFVHSSNDVESMHTLRKSASQLLGSPTIYTCSSPDLLNRFYIPETSTWALIAIKDQDMDHPASIIHGITMSEEKLAPWLLAHRLSTSLELTQDTFQSVMNAPHAPLVVIAAVTKNNMEKVKERFRDVARKWRFKTSGTGVIHGREVIFSWMDAERWADWMKSMYGITKESLVGESLDDVPVIISDHKRLIYYDTDPSDSRIKLSSSTSIFSAAEAAAAGKLRYNNSENYVERLARVLSQRMLSLESYVVTYPFRAVMFFAAFLAVVFWVLKRFIVDDIPSDREHRAKGDRID